MTTKAQKLARAFKLEIEGPPVKGKIQYFVIGTSTIEPSGNKCKKEIVLASGLGVSPLAETMENIDQSKYTNIRILKGTHYTSGSHNTLVAADGLHPYRQSFRHSKTKVEK